MTGETRAEAIARAAARLAEAGIPDVDRDARLLFRWAAGLDGAALSAGLRDRVTGEEAGRFAAAIEKRLHRVPVSHITGKRLFWGRSFAVTGDVLDPRPETETLVATALEGGPANRVLDLGTGSGCLLLTLLAEWPGATGVGVDRSAKALEIARVNAESLGLADRAGFLQGDWTAGLSGPFDLVVSNPPYIPEAEIAELAPEVRLHEPREALAAGADGLDAYRAILDGLGAVLAPGGRFVGEFGAGQGEAVLDLFQQRGYRAKLISDMDERPRCICAIA